VLPLLEGVRRLREGSLPPRTVCLTFDDGYANNLKIALPLLEKYETPATVFLATSYTESSTFYPFLQLKLIRLWNSTVPLPEYKSTPVDEVLREAARFWSTVDAELSSQQRETLRPLTVDEVCSADGSLLQFAAHSHTHGIARNETPGRRRSEVLISVQRVSEWTGRPVQIYSYPNGEAGDFGVPEWEALKAAGVETAVTGISGANRWPSNPLALKRYPLTINHDESRFRAEATGFRHLMMSAAGRRPQ
jgi:peptidoglycan/xylan/chitin deacetylase (PgdA/CDA1 family)